MALALVTRLIPPREAALGARLAAGVAVLTVLLAAIVLVSLSSGPLAIPVSHVVAIIAEPTGVHLTDYDRTEELVVERIRIPRIVVGALVGMALGIAGATMQALFRNPLADPGTIGVASGGAAAAVIAIATGASTLFFLALPLIALAGAIGTAFLVYGIAIASGRFSVATLILSPERAESPLWSGLGKAAGVLGKLALYGLGLVALVGAGAGVRGVVRSNGGDRIDSLEQRVTDTQDVLIALSEKYDRLEERFVELAAQIRHDDTTGD